MAIREFFAQLGQRYLVEASRALGQDAGSLYQQAAKLCLDGKLEEAASVADSAEQILCRALELRSNNTKLVDSYVPAVISQLKELGLEKEPEADFLRGLSDCGQAGVILPEIITRPAVGFGLPSNGVNGVGNPLHLDDRGESERGRKDPIVLTHKQIQICVARFRLVDTGNEVVTIREAVEYVYKDLLATKVAEGAVYNQAVAAQVVTISSSWPPIREKLERGFQMLGGDQARLPFTDEQLQKLCSDTETYQFYARLNRVPAYQGMTLKELSDYTGKRNVEIAKPGGENKLDLPVELAITEAEAYFGVKAIIENSSLFGLDLQTRRYLGKCLSDLGPSVPNDPAYVRALWEKYLDYKRMTVEEQAALMERGGKMIRSVLLEFGKRSDTDIQAALGIRAGKNGKELNNK